MFMKFTCYFIVGYIFNFVQAQNKDESISFSPTSYKRPDSYWHGNVIIGKNHSFLEEGINMQIYLNKYQGLLFYIIDSNYQTLWVEFANDLLEIKYYNFKINETDKRHLKISDLMSTNKNGNEANLSFSYNQNEIKVSSDNKFQTIDHLRSSSPIPEQDVKKFIETFTLPIPYFNKSNENTEIYVWIGNVPQSSLKFQNNAKLRTSRFNLWGCVKYFAIKNSRLKLATSGERVGEMIKPFCKPVCNSSSCYNKGQCFELWRGNYKCDCEYSQFIGQRCELEYSIKFNGSFSVSKTHPIKFKRLKFSFKPDIVGEYNGLKLLSLKLKKLHYFQIYIDSYEFLHGRLIIHSNPSNIDVKFKLNLKHNETYIILAEITINEINMKIFNSQTRSLIETQAIDLKNLLILFEVENILVGDLHIPITDSMKFFKGCLTNLVLQSENKQFILNTSKISYPQCESSGEYNQTNHFQYNHSILLQKKNVDKNKFISDSLNTEERKNNYKAYIIIAVVTSISMMIIVFVILFFKIHSRKSNQKSSFHVLETRSNDMYSKFNEFNEIKKVQPLTYGNTTDLAPCHIYPSPICMTFKPAYKAKSMCSSITNGSLMSLPLPPSPTLAIPEDREKLQ